MYIANFNFLFTALPYLVKALLDQDINIKIDGSHRRALLPLLYHDTVRNGCFNQRRFLQNAVNSILQAAILFFVPATVLGWGDQYTMSLASFTALLLVANIQLMMNSKYITLLNVAAVLVTSVLPYFLFVWQSNTMSSSYMQNVVGHAVQSKAFWASITVTVGACSAFEFAQLTIRRLLAPSLSDKIRQDVLTSANIDQDHYVSIDMDKVYDDYFSDYYNETNLSGITPSTSSADDA